MFKGTVNREISLRSRLERHVSGRKSYTGEAMDKEVYKAYIHIRLIVLQQGSVPPCFFWM